jgi:hypothetical protein
MRRRGIRCSASESVPADVPDRHEGAAARQNERARKQHHRRDQQPETQQQKQRHDSS